MPDFVKRNVTMDKQVLDYVMACYFSAKGFWSAKISGTVLSNQQQFSEFRKRYYARRSVASLDSDIKEGPFPRSSNVGVGAEVAFGEFLIPNIIANTRDLEPSLQVIDEQTGEVDHERTAFHDTYHRRMATRKLLEHSTREILKVGNCYHKWTYKTLWRQTEVPMAVWVNPFTKQPVISQDPVTGEMAPQLADKFLPDELKPREPITGKPFEIVEIPSVEWKLKKEGPLFHVRPTERVLFPPNTTEVDPDDWDYVIDTMEVSPWWFLGKEGDPWEGRLQNLPQLWKWLGVNPNELYKRPLDGMSRKIKLIEFHGPYAVTSSGKPAEIVALVAPDANLLLGWRITIFPRRPFFNRQVWNRGETPIGIGIPESIRGLRDALDASVNQDIDSGNLWNHPPLLISDLAMIDDEEYELTGPGTRWIVRDINGAKVLAQPPSVRNPIERENWLISMAQRIWGVTDLNLNAPTSSLSPNVTTARGTMAVLNQGNIKFGHLIKRIAEVDSQEYQFANDVFSTMLSNPKVVAFQGKPITVKPEKRGEFFGPQWQITAIGNGVTTNPIVRQQVMGNLYQIMVGTQNPFMVGDLENFMKMTKDLISASGMAYQLKDPQALQLSKMVTELMQTPAGQKIIPPALQQAALVHQQMAALAQASTQGNGNAPMVQR